MNDAHWMRLAIAKAREGVARGQSPFGAAIVRDGQLIACEHNLVLATTDITAHAEVTAIRRACAAVNDIHLPRCTIYSTCEPCPMCFSAIHWARISTIVFGARIGDAQELGFSELTIPNEVMKREGGSPVVLVPDFLREECLALFREFAKRPDRRTY